jgi:hypothetical protein
VELNVTESYHVDGEYWVLMWNVKGLTKGLVRIF